MFTGIIDHCGQVKSIETQEKALRVTVNCQFTDLMLGESIAIDGICLTVTDLHKDGFSCDVSPETLRLTIAGKWQAGTAVNLERSLRPMDRMGGHFVSGHVDHQCQLHTQKQVGDFIALEFRGVLPKVRELLVKKGSICVNGVSLTLNEVFDEGFEVMLIPHTLQRTNLQFLKVGDAVNVEYDLLAKLVTNVVRIQREHA